MKEPVKSFVLVALLIILLATLVVIVGAMPFTVPVSMS